MHLIYTHPLIGQPRPPISHLPSCILHPRTVTAPDAEPPVLRLRLPLRLGSFLFSLFCPCVDRRRTFSANRIGPPASQLASQPPRASVDTRPPTAENIAPLRRRRFFQTLHPSRDRLFCRSASALGARGAASGGGPLPYMGALRLLEWSPEPCLSGSSRENGKTTLETLFRRHKTQHSRLVDPSTH